MASAEAKPDGVLVVAPDREREFLHPLPVERLWGVGPATAPKLHATGLTRVGQLAEMREAALVSIVGRALGRHLHAIASSRDPRPVRPRRGRGSFGAQCALARASTSPEAVDAVAIALVDRVTRRMRAAGRAAAPSCCGCASPTSRERRGRRRCPRDRATRTVLATARGLLATAMPLIERQGLTLVGVAVANLENALPAQLMLPFDRHHGPPSTMHSTRCAPGSGRPRSPGPCSSGATRACRCRFSPIEAGVLGRDSCRPGSTNRGSPMGSKAPRPAFTVASRLVRRSCKPTATL